jgi:putative Mg2+ transporter-C (MgtC) family protein
MMWGPRVERMLPQRTGLMVVLTFGVDACPTLAEVSAVAAKWGYDVLSDSLAVHSDNGQLEWRFVAVAVSRGTAVAVPDLARDLVQLPGVVSFQLSPSRN